MNSMSGRMQCSSLTKRSPGTKQVEKLCLSWGPELAKLSNSFRQNSLCHTLVTKADKRPDDIHIEGTLDEWQTSRTSICPVHYFIMKTLLLSFIALIAVVAHATPTINNRTESLQAGDSLDGRARPREMTVSCAQCSPNPRCYLCLDRGQWGECWRTQKSTCASYGVVPIHDTCGKGYWRCEFDCSSYCPQ